MECSCSFPWICTASVENYSNLAAWVKFASWSRTVGVTYSTRYAHVRTLTWPMSRYQISAANWDAHLVFVIFVIKFPSKHLAKPIQCKAADLRSRSWLLRPVSIEKNSRPHLLRILFGYTLSMATAVHGNDTLQLGWVATVGETWYGHIDGAQVDQREGCPTVM